MSWKIHAAVESNKRILDSSRMSGNISQDIRYTATATATDSSYPRFRWN